MKKDQHEKNKQHVKDAMAKHTKFPARVAAAAKAMLENIVKDPPQNVEELRLMLAEFSSETDELVNDLSA